MQATTLTPTPAAAATTPRHDLYAGIHKALRLAMGDTLARLGRADLADAHDLGATLDQVDALLAMFARHVEHENAFIHPALEARRPGASQVTAGAHDEHVASIDALAAEVRALRSAGAERRPVLAQRLYHHLALFVAENLQHMHVEETVNNAALWALYDDEELTALHDRLVASIPPTEMGETLGWMAAAFSPQELAGLLGGVRSQIPPEAFTGLLATLREPIGAARWARLRADLGLPQDA